MHDVEAAHELRLLLATSGNLFFNMGDAGDAREIAVSRASLILHKTFSFMTTERQHPRLRERVYKFFELSVESKLNK